MSNTNNLGSMSGRMLDENGNVVNIADAIGGVETGKVENIKSYSPMSGNFIREDGTVVNITKALLEKLRGGGSGGGVQADLSQNDETAPDYVKGRTHYKDFLPLLPETTLVGDEENAGQATAEVDFEIIKGNTYEVFYNGKKYTCIAVEHDFGDGFPISAIGNLELVGGTGNGEPFAIIASQGIMIVMPLDGSIEITLEIKVFSAVKIPGEYLPHCVLKITNEEVTETSSTNQVRISIDTTELYNALKYGAPIYIDLTKYRGYFSLIQATGSALPGGNDEELTLDKIGEMYGGIDGIGMILYAIEPLLIGKKEWTIYVNYDS